jgi:transposase
MNSEAAFLFHSMFMLINLLISIFLEKMTPKNNKNSSKPSSQTEKDESSLSHLGTNTKGHLESDITASNTRTVETLTTVTVSTCSICGEDLTQTPVEKLERRTQIDIVFEKVIQHVEAEQKHCHTCDSTVKGKFPEDMPGPLQ